jgi:hypothetical protein
MPPSLTLTTIQIFLVVCSGITSSSARAFAQRAPSMQSSNPFEDYFNRFAAAQEIGSSRSEDVYEKLAESIGAMTPKEIAAGISVIDRQIDNTAEPQNLPKKGQAAYLLRIIASRPDGPDLLASQMDRLASMLNDPSHVFSAPAAMALQMIGYRRPEVAWPILEAALEDPNVNNKTGVGPGIAVILLRMGPHGDDVTEHVAQYMRRPDLTEDQLLQTIIGIDSSPTVPDILTAELVRCLDRSNEHIKIRALVGIARSGPSAKDAARTRVQMMANDPRETTHVRRLAAAALEGEITENPESDK